MSHLLKRRGILLLLPIVLVFALACAVTMNTPAPVQPSFDPTKAVLELEATSMALQLTQAALEVEAQKTIEPPPTKPTLLAPTEQASPTPIPPTATPSMDDLMKTAEILVYENTDGSGIGLWIRDALDGMGFSYTHTGSYSGHFMEYLNSGTKWDLIIVGAEDKDRISGEFWDVINTRLARDKAALIAEIWYLDTEANGPISKILGGCGIRFEKDYPLAESIYWWVPEHPVFNEPNVVLPLLHYSRYWANQTGDKIRLGGGGDATLLAGLVAQPSTRGSVLATCYEGRVIIQTFSDHDYHQADIVPLWQNYIYNTLKSHFLAIQ